MVILSALQPTAQTPIPRVDANRHLELVEGILHDEVGVAIVHAAHDILDVGGDGVGEEEEFRAGQRLEAGEAEEGGLERFDARGRGGARPGVVLPREAKTAHRTFELT